MSDHPEEPQRRSEEPSPQVRHVRKVAAFDFDGTVSRRDTLIPFVTRFAGVRRSAAGIIGTTWDALGRRNLAPRDRDAIKERMLERLLAGRDARELDRAAGVYAAQLIDQRLRAEMVEEIRRHVAAGHETLFVSASLSNYLQPIARYLAMTDVIAVELEVSDGALTGSMVHPNVRAAQKAVRLRQWLAMPASTESKPAVTGPLAGVELWAYGNSSGDHELLELADHAYWLGKPQACPAGVETYSEQVGFR